MAKWVFMLAGTVGLNDDTKQCMLFLSQAHKKFISWNLFYTTISEKNHFYLNETIKYNSLFYSCATKYFPKLINFNLHIGEMDSTKATSHLLKPEFTLQVSF